MKSCVPWEDKNSKFEEHLIISIKLKRARVGARPPASKEREQELSTLCLTVKKSCIAFTGLNAICVNFLVKQRFLSAADF